MPSKRSKPDASAPDALETVVETVDPRDLTLLDKNARFMPERQFKQLVENLRRDGVLTSAPLIHEREGRRIVLSGNHRVKAAIAAGLEQIPAIRIVSEITDARSLAIQLSHNAIVGDDDTNVLRELYDSLDLLEQRYSGLTDSDLGVLEDPALVKLSVGLPKYEELTIAFLPDDLSEFQDNLDRLIARSEKASVYFARFEHYHDFMAAILKTKELRKIGNDGIALLVMSQLALERLEQPPEPGEVVDGD